MDKATQILAAIEQLARNVSAQIEAVRAEVKADIAAVRADVEHLQIDVAELKEGQGRILEHLDIAELKGRVEEHSRTIASLIPTRVAAVPSR